MPSALRTYYFVAKPGIIFGNTLAGIAGFFFAISASSGTIRFPLLVAMTAGLALVIGCGCVLNNYIDRDIDALMARTKHRALAEASFPKGHALIYAAILGACGALILALFASPLAAALALLGLFMYVFPYTLWSKRQTPWSTPIGSISGAIPPLVGYAAAAGHLDPGAFLVFLALAVWQMPHFYAIAIFHRDEYAAAGVRVLPVARGIRATKWHMLAYLIAWVLLVPCFTLLGFSSAGFLIVTEAIALAWLALGIIGFRKTDDIRWARRVFFFSILVLIAFCCMIVLDALLR